MLDLFNESTSLGELKIISGSLEELLTGFHLVLGNSWKGLGKTEISSRLDILRKGDAGYLVLFILELNLKINSHLC